MSSTTHDSVEIFSDTTTSWISLTTTFSSVAGCSTGYYVLGSNDISSSVFAYGPNGPNSCLPSQGTKWWNQVLTTATTTSIGPFICPADYYTVYNLSMGHGPSSTLIGCCPSGFTYENRVAFANPSQCTSSLSSGVTLKYQSKVGDVWSTLHTPLSSPFLVRGVHINGWNWDSDAASTTSSSSGSRTSPAAAADTATDSSSSTSTAIHKSSSGLSTGTTAGIAVGASLAALGIAALFAALFFVRRHRAKNAAKSSTTADLKGDGPDFPDLINNDRAWARTQQGSELKGNNHGNVPYTDRDVKAEQQQKFLGTENSLSPVSERSRGSSIPPANGSGAQELPGRQIPHEIGSSGVHVMHEMP